MAEERPNPDALLAAIRKDENTRRRGHLKVFLGMSPGVGKTYAMLEAAHRVLATGTDVVIGYVETHGRAETDALTTGLPLIPRKSLIHRGLPLTEMDLDAILARHPQLVLVDELAHTNAPGSRHPKRYQDVRELLDSGIDVFTTINVQHVGSRAEIVREFTGATIHETVPDSLLDEAEIEVIDLPPKELLARLAAGKVYVPERADAAAAGFFREGNLTALRELALRLAAEHVGQNVRDYLATKRISGPWKSGQRLLVAISPSPLSESMARWTRRLADNLQAPWIALYVEVGRPLSAEDQARLQKNLTLAKELGAEVITTTDQDVVAGILRVAHQHNITQIVAGKPATGGFWGSLRPNRLLQRLIRESGEIDVYCVRAGAGGETSRRLAPRFGVLAPARQYAVAMGAVGVVTCVNFALQNLTGPYALSMLYLMANIVLALFVGRGPVLSAAFTSAMLWNYFFLPPIHTFYIESAQDGLMFGMFFVVAIAMGQLTARLRAQQAAEREREERATALYLLTRQLAEVQDYAELLGGVISHFGRVFAADVAILLPGSPGEDELVPYPFGSLAIPAKDFGVADWAYRNRKLAGLGTDTLPSASALYLPLATPGSCVGVVGLQPKGKQGFSLQQLNLLDNFIRQTAVVIDRQRLRDASQVAQLLSESERLSKSLLDSVSHELRTPLAAITSAASGLADLGATDQPAVRLALTAEIREATQRLNRVVGNLLDMTRLESGRMQARMDWCDVGDLIHVAVSHTVKELERHKLKVQVAEGLPLVKMDFVLMEEALVNLLYNASLHTPVGSEVVVAADASPGELIVTVSDNGPGFPPEVLPKLFGKFYRAPGSRAGGTGLGLSIVKGFIEAQGGSIRAANRPGGGAVFEIRLPITEAPMLPPEMR